MGNYNNYADFSSMVFKQMTMAIKGLGKFHQVDPFMSVEGLDGEDMLVLSPEGLKELRKAMREYGDQMRELDREEAKILNMNHLPLCCNHYILA